MLQLLTSDSDRTMLTDSLVAGGVSLYCTPEQEGLLMPHMHACLPHGKRLDAFLLHIVHSLTAMKANLWFIPFLPMTDSTLRSGEGFLLIVD